MKLLLAAAALTAASISAPAFAETNDASKAVIVAAGQEAAAKAKKDDTSDRTVSASGRTPEEGAPRARSALPSSSSKAVIVARARAASPASEKGDTAGKSEARSKPGGKKTGGKANLHALVSEVAAAHGVPAGLAHAVVTVESRYNPRARGAAGEVGLMQIKPATARGIGYTGSIAALYDPATNLEWGMRYLAGAYKLGGGSVCGTALRYNAGHFARRMTRGTSAYCGRLKAAMASAGTRV